MRFHHYLSLFALVIGTFVSPASGSFTVLSSGPSSVSLVFEAEWDEQIKSVRGEQYSLWTTPEINGTLDHHGMVTPVQHFNVHLPGTTPPQISVTGTHTVRRQSNPFPPSDGHHEFSPKMNGALVTFQGFASFRGYTLGRFLLRPATFENGEAVLVERAEITITWPAGEGPVADETASGFARQVLGEGVIIPDNRLVRSPEGFKKPTTPDIDRRGRWFKIPVSQSGMIRLTFDWLQTQDVPVEETDLDKIRVFAPPNHGLPLNTPRGASLEEVGPALLEIAILTDDADGNGQFSSGDALEFYAQGVNRYHLDGDDVQYTMNPYETTNYYWLNIPTFASEAEGRRVESYSISGNQPVRSTAPGQYHFEEDLNNFLNSGTLWFGRTFFGTRDQQAFSLALPGILPDSSVQVEARFGRGNSSASNEFTVSINGTHVGQTYIPRGESADAVRAITQHYSPGQSPLQSDANTLTVLSTSASSSAQGHLDYIDIRYIQQLRFPENRDAYRFFTRPQTGVRRYRIADIAAGDVIALDITDPGAVFRLPVSNEQNGILFPVDFGEDRSRREIVVVRREAGSRPERIIPVEGYNQPVLRRSRTGVDHLIITADEFRAEAERLADFRSGFDDPIDGRLTSSVVSAQEIYDAFSGGLQDPVALRNFITYAYHRWSGDEPLQYVLLFGDGDYDYRNITGRSTNFVPTWQNSRQSEYTTKAIEDAFVRIIGNDAVPDLALGRLTCQSLDEAQHQVDKIIAYETDAPFGQWRNTITLVGDDPYRPEGPAETWGAGHIEELENRVLPQIPELFYQRKIYLPDYPIQQDLSSYGKTRPAVTEALMEQLRNGTLIINFSGHGSPTVWTQERVLTMERDLQRIHTGRKLPLWIAATCNWGQFDLVESRSMTEAVLGLESNGAIAVISATRLSFLGANLTMMGDIFRSLFSDPMHRGNSIPLGPAFLQAKLITGNQLNAERYALFGDPALRLASPRYSADISSMDPDTLAALAEVTFAGEVGLDSLSASSQFRGEGVVTVFDSDVQVRHDYARFSLRYALPGSRIFHGPVSITNGAFSGKMIVPKDINYGGDQGKITILYQGADSVTTGAGHRGPLTFQGTATGIEDARGPDIDIGFQGYQFQPGDAVASDAVLDVRLHDAFGLNLTGSIGHQLKLVISGDLSAEYNMTDFFTYNTDSYQTGHIRYPLPGLDPGEYTFTIRAWDTSNNLSVRSAEVTLVEGGEFAISRAYNYPNPMQDRTDFTFSLNRPAEVTISIYTLSGQPIRHLESRFTLPGFQSIRWNGRDAYGAPVANGVYLYKISATTTGDQTDQDTYIGKLAITR